VALCLAFMGTAVGKAPSKEQVEVYYELLRDIAFDVLMEACRRVIMQHKFSTLPTVATIREIAGQLTGTVSQLTAMEALQVVRRLISRHGGSYATKEDIAAAYAEMPPQVAACVTAFGWHAICDSDSPEVLQAQWRMTWDRVSARENEKAAMLGASRPVRIGGGRPVLDTSRFGLIE
jgi:hypothetical protein